MKKLKTLLKKGLALTLAIAVANSYSNVSANTQKTPIVFSETIEFSPLKTFDGTVNVSTRDTNSIPLINGTAEKWIDRVVLPKEAKDFYAMLEEGADNDGVADILIDDKYFDAGEVEIMKLTTFPLEKLDEIGNWIQAVTNAFDRDHPEVFWLSGRTMYSCHDSSLYLTLRDDKEDYDLRSSNYPNAESIKKAIIERDTAIETILKGIENNATPVEKIKYFNNWLTTHNQYNTSTNLSTINNSCRECISALKGTDGKSGPVCEGYARAFKVLCDNAEIPCVLVDGNAINSSGKAGAHMWNYAKVDDNWYGVDVTWDDPMGGINDKISSFENEDYLLVGADTTINNLKFIDSHPVENQVSTDGVAFTNGPKLSSTEYKEGLKIVSKPSLTGTYGESIEQMTLKDGEVTLSGKIVTGTWSKSSEDLNKILSVGTTEQITVTFTPNETSENPDQESLSVQIIPTVIPKSLSEDISISLKETSYIYDGTEKTPSVTVKDGNTTLIEGKDYTLSYQNNVNASSTATVSILGTGNYTDTVTKNFSIAKADIPAVTINKTYLYTKGSDGETNIDLTEYFPSNMGTVTYSTKQEGTIIKGTPSVKENKLIFNVSAGEVGNTASITVTAGSDNYSDIVITINLTLSEQKPIALRTGTEVSTNGKLVYGDTLSKLTLNAEFVEARTDTVIDGKLSWKDPSQVLPAGDSQVTWVFTPNNDEYSPLEGFLSIETQTATPIVTAPTATEITYHPAKTLNDISLNGSNGTWTVAGEEKIVEGVWTWATDTTVPTVVNTGYTAVFTPKDNKNYNQAEATVALTVKKATPVLTGMPTASAITYGETLADSILTSGGAVYSSIDSNIKIEGSFVWKNTEIKPTFVSDNIVTEYAIVFSPKDKNYNTLDLALAITVNQAEKAPGMPAAAMEVENTCQTVGDITLSTGWNWEEADRTKALVVDETVTASAIYIGNDKGNYKEESIVVEIVRLKAEEKPPVSDNIGNNGSNDGNSNIGNNGNSGGSSNTGSNGSFGTGTNSGTSGTNNGVTNPPANDTTDDNNKKEEDQNTITDENKPDANVNNSDNNNTSDNNNNLDKNQSSNSSNTNEKDKDNNSSKNDSEYKTVSLEKKQTSVLKINNKKQIKLQVNQKKEITSLKYKAVKNGKKKGSVVAKLYKNKKMIYKVQIKPVGKKLKVVVLNGKGLKVKYSGKKALIRKNGKTLFTVNLKTS